MAPPVRASQTRAGPIWVVVTTRSPSGLKLADTARLKPRVESVSPATSATTTNAPAHAIEKRLARVATSNGESFSSLRSFILTAFDGLFIVDIAATDGRHPDPVGV
jgi:hypothetical protein